MAKVRKQVTDREGLFGTWNVEGFAPFIPSSKRGKNTWGESERLSREKVRNKGK
jgi:hypothetical protein